jgi:hypothetical protein
MRRATLRWLNRATVSMSKDPSRRSVRGLLLRSMCHSPFLTASPALSVVVGLLSRLAERTEREGIALHISN